jgi:hypothetical protein
MRRHKIRILGYFTIVVLVLAAAVCGIFLPEALRLVSAASTRVEDPLWQDVAPGSLDALKDSRLSQPALKRYRAVRLNEAALSKVLAGAPMEFTEAGKDPQNEIALPMPDGAFARFRFVESPIMTPELAAQYPTIKTYRGWSIDDPATTTRFDRTSDGFHAIVLSPSGAFYIAPLSRDDKYTYASYLTRDSGADVTDCLVDSDQRSTKPTKADPSALSRSSISPSSANGATLRTYRLAVSATPEYTASFGSSALAMNAISTTVNNVNLIYQNEMSVSLSLVATFIFDGTVPDPYTNGNPGNLITENQAFLNGALPLGYDVGQVFDASNAGGLASLGVVCNSLPIFGRAGRGTSAAPNPTGTGFDLLVAHELGHQFGADHTFNGTAGSCGNPGQLNNDTAYEPGGGSTIMAYPGICGTMAGACLGPGDGDNIQCNRSPYFHWQSLAAMEDYLDNNGGCATTTNNNNTPPSVTPPFPSLGFYLIPKLTPFSLTASATDAEDADLTFCWEQADNGSPGPPTGDRIDNPLFRSFPPTENPTRTFPQMSDVLSGTSTPGEIMPTTQRRLTFVVTVRDNHAPGGGFNQGAVLVDVWASRGPFAVLQPAAGTQALQGQLLTVTWDVANTDLRPISTSHVRILISTDSGNDDWTVLESSTPNDGSHTVTVPHANTQEARIKVEAIDNIFFNVSPAFTIIPGPTITSAGSITVTKGGPSVTGEVAVVADGRDAADSLTVVTTTTPLPIGVSLGQFTVASNGKVSTTATAQCISFGGTHTIRVEVTNSAGLTATTTFDLTVDSNLPPTLGDYDDASVIAGQRVVVTPSALLSDPNGNLSPTGVTAWTTTPPLFAGLTVDQTGVVTVNVNTFAQIRTYEIKVEALDTCGEPVTRNFFLTVTNSPPQVNLNGTSLRTTQGGALPPTVAIGTVSDPQDAAGALGVSASSPVSGLTVWPTNSAGTVMATASATCAVAPGTYTVTLTVTDSANAQGSGTLSVIVDPNTPPTLGAYLDSGVTVDGAVLIVPNAAPSDPNNPSSAVTVTVQPIILPGGGQVTVQSNGRVHVNTVWSTVLGTHQIIVTARDSCSAQVSRSFKLRVRSASCVAAQNAVFVADTDNHRIQRFSGVTWNIIGPGTKGTGLGQFDSPESVVATADGRYIYVADAGNNRIQWSQNFGGTWAVFASNLVPKGLVLDRDGNLYVSDANDNRVVRYAGAVPGTPIVLATGGSGAGRVNNPNGLAIDCRMNLYIADTGNNRILVIATADSAVLPNTGTIVAGSGAGLNPAQVSAPQGVAVANDGRLYIADTGNNRVLALATAPLPGPAVALCTTGAAVGQVSGPEGLTIAAFTAGPLAGVSSIVVSDTNNNRIQARSLPAGAWMLPPPPVGNGPGSGTGQFMLPSKIR